MSSNILFNFANLQSTQVCKSIINSNLWVTETNISKCQTQLIRWRSYISLQTRDAYDSVVVHVILCETKKHDYAMWKCTGTMSIIYLNSTLVYWSNSLLECGRTWYRFPIQTCDVRLLWYNQLASALSKLCNSQNHLWISANIEQSSFVCSFDDSMFTQF